MSGPRPEPDLGIAGIEGATEIGRGGFGVVYRARQPQFGRAVAVKLLGGGALDETARLRFERERLAMGVISNHPNIVTVYEAGFADGRPYIVMEFMDEGSLADQVARAGPRPWPEVVTALVKVCGGLDAAHRAAVLHRDVKPENILVSAYGEPKLADFGIARVEGSAETRAGGVTASLNHAAPEVLAGEPPSASSDVYGMASTAYTLLTGSAPFVRDTDATALAVVARIATEAPPDLRHRGIPEEVVRVLERAMLKDPAHRTGSAVLLGRQLQWAQQALGQPVTEMRVLEGRAPDSSGPSAAPAPTPSFTAAVAPTAPPPTPASPSPPAPAPAPASGGSPAAPPAPPPGWGAQGQPAGWGAAAAPGPGAGPAADRRRSPVPWVVGGALVALLLLGVLAAVLLGGGDGDGGDDDVASTTTETTAADDPEDEADLPDGEPPVGLGSDAALDRLADDCFDGEMEACDDLYVQSPVDSTYEDYGSTCGERTSPQQGDCRATFPSPELLELRDECEGGDNASCDELYFDTPSGSELEEVGATCGGRSVELLNGGCEERFGP